MVFRIAILLLGLLVFRIFAALWAEAEKKPAFSLIPMPFVFSQPETGFGGGAMLMAQGEVRLPVWRRFGVAIFGGLG